MPEGYVPCTTYWVIYENRIIGLANIKHYLNNFLRKKGGHIGIALAKEYRGRGIGYDTARLLVEKARSEFGIEDILMKRTREHSEQKALRKAGCRANRYR